MTNKKLIFGVLVIIAAAGISLSVFNKYSTSRPGGASTPTASTTAQIKVSLECPLDKTSEYVVITDSSSSLALSSRKTLLKAGLSEQYLNKHFSFLCGIEYSSNNHRVAWKYIIGEYESTLEGIVNALPNQSPKFSDVVGKLHDIQSALPRTSAEKRVEQCLGEKQADIEVTLVGGPAPFPNFANKPEAIHNNENGGLFMIGSTVPNIDPHDPLVSYVKYGYLNLETEKCTTSDWTFVID